MLIPKKSGPKRAAMINSKLYSRALRFADKEEYTLGSVFETALEEFLDDREDDGTGDEPAPGKKANGATPARAAVRP